MILPRMLDPNFNTLKPWSCMESFPFLFRRSDFSHVRQWFITSTNTTSFDEGYNVIMSRMKTALDFGQFALLGAWAYTYNRGNNNNNNDNNIFTFSAAMPFRSVPFRSVLF